MPENIQIVCRVNSKANIRNMGQVNLKIMSISKRNRRYKLVVILTISLISLQNSVNHYKCCFIIITDSQKIKKKDLTLNIELQ